MCDQVIALISPEHAESIVWNERSSEDELSEGDQDESDRMFSFEVAKTNEQEESVSVRKGFRVRIHHRNSYFRPSSTARCTVHNGTTPYPRTAT